ncbi:hypothetical protein FOZ63_007491, partial [Perkinsus olseni]
DESVMNPAVRKASYMEFDENRQTSEWKDPMDKRMPLFSRSSINVDKSDAAMDIGVPQSSNFNISEIMLVWFHVPMMEVDINCSSFFNPSSIFGEVSTSIASKHSSHLELMYLSTTKTLILLRQAAKSMSDVTTAFSFICVGYRCLPIMEL